MAEVKKEIPVQCSSCLRSQRAGQVAEYRGGAGRSGRGPPAKPDPQIDWVEEQVKEQRRKEHEEWSEAAAKARAREAEEGILFQRSRLSPWRFECRLRRYG